MKLILNDITDLFKIKDIWFEPTNHHHISVKEYDEWTQKYVEKFGNVRWFEQPIIKMTTYL